MPRLITLVLGLITAILCGSILAADTQPTVQSLSRMPLAFTKNNGQWDDRVLFRANAGGATMWFTKEGVTYQFTRRVASPVRAALAAARDSGSNAAATGDREGRPYAMEGLDSRLRGNDKEGGIDLERDSVEQLVLTAKFVGANPNPEVLGEGQMEYRCNYFIGNDPAKWHTDVPNYEAITLKDIYPGIDLKYSGDGTGQAAYEFIAAPGADIAQIKVEYEGAEETSIDADGRMIVRTKWGDMITAVKSPANGVLSGTAFFSQLSEKTIGFEAGGASQQALGTLAVGLVYSTYLGGTGDDRGNGIAVDGSGNAYVTGYTESSNYPTTTGAYDPTYGGGDAFVAKFSPSGALIYSTYLGGGGGDYGYGIAVDGSGNAYVTGLTGSDNFPTLNPYQTSQMGLDVFVTKLSSTGNSLIYSTYLGGGQWEWGTGIAVDGSGNACVTGITVSYDFPTLNPYQGTHQGGTLDAFVTKLSSTGNTLIYSTYLGGGDYDFGTGIAVDGSGNAYATGYTGSSNFPTLNPYQTGGGVFVTKFSGHGTMTYSTCLNGGSGQGIAVDGSGNAYVTGYTSSSDFPTLNPYQTYQGGSDVFVTKLSNSGDGLIYSTYLGGGQSEWGTGIAVDGSGNAYVTGGTSAPNFPTQNPYQGTYQGGSNDAFVTKLSSSGNSLIYSTYLGGGGDDGGTSNHRLGGAIAVDDSGDAYVTGWTGSANFPTLNPYQTNQGGQDVFVTKLSEGGSGNQPPVAMIDSITPNPAVVGTTDAFAGHGTDTDGSIVAYNWQSSIDGQLSTAASFSSSSLSVGSHTIYFKVQDDDLAWSPEVSTTLTITAKVFTMGRDNFVFSNLWSNMWPFCESFLSALACPACDATWNPLDTNVPMGCAKCWNDYWEAGRVFPTWDVFRDAFGCEQTEYFCPTHFRKKRGAEIFWNDMRECWRGSCGGFCVASLLFFNGQLSLQELFPGPGKTDLHSVLVEDENYKARDMINKFNFYQFGEVQRDYWDLNWTLTPNVTLQRLQQALNDGILSETYLNVGGGHAVVPYRVETDNGNPTLKYIYVYDSDYPNDPTKRITVNTDANTWAYGNSEYNQNYLFLMDPIADYAMTPVLPTTFKPFPAKGDYSYVLCPRVLRASMQFSGAGTIGFDGDSTYTSLSSGHVITAMQDSIALPIGFYLPQGNWECEFGRITDTEFRLSVFLTNAVLEYVSKGIDTLDQERLRVNDANGSLLLMNPSGKSRNMQFSAVSIASDSELTFDVGNSIVAANDSLGLSLLPAKQLRIDNYGHGMTYDLSIAVYGDSVDTEFYRYGIPIGSDCRHQVLPNWRDHNDSLFILVDSGMTGTFTDTIVVANQGRYLCGDADGSHDVNIADAVFLVEYIFSGGAAPSPLAAGDTDCSGDINIADCVYLIEYIFSGGSQPCAGCK